MNQQNIHTTITGILDQFPEILIGILFGSAAENKLTFESDLDLELAGNMGAQTGGDQSNKKRLPKSSRILNKHASCIWTIMLYRMMKDFGSLFMHPTG